MHMHTRLCPHTNTCDYKVMCVCVRVCVEVLDAALAAHDGRTIWRARQLGMSHTISTHYSNLVDIGPLQFLFRQLGHPEKAFRLSNHLSVS